MPQTNEASTPAGLGPVMGPLLFMTGLFFLNFTTRMIMSPLLPTIEDDLGLSHVQAGSLFFFLSLGYMITLTTSGAVASRLGHRGTVILSTLGLGTATVLIGLAPGLTALRLGLLAVGLAGGLYLPSAIATITTLVEPRHWSRAIAVHELAPNSSFMLAPLAAELILLFMPWREGILVLGSLCLVLGLAYLRWGRGGNFKGEALNPASVKEVMGDPKVWLMVFIFSLGVGMSLGIYMVMPLFLKEVHAMDRSTANFLVAASRLSGVGMAFLAGWAADRLGPRVALAWVLGLAGLFTIGVGLCTGAPLLVMVFLQPALAVCLFPIAFATLSGLVRPEKRNIAVSLVMATAMLAGGGGLPTLISWLGDHQMFHLGFVIIGTLALLGAVMERRLG